MSNPSSTRPDRTPIVPPGAIEHLVADMTVVASADVTLAALQARLAERGQWLPIDGEADATLGHLVEVNSTGPLRLGYGAWRDLLLGVQFTNGRGELISAGGRTVKNVAGYDLTKLMVGQAAALGKILTITTRTYRRPTAAVVAEWPVDASPTTRVNDLLAGVLRPTWMMIVDGTLRCGHLGDEAAVTYWEQTLATASPSRVERRDLDADAAERSAAWRWPGDAGTARLSVPPTRVVEVMRTLGARAADPVHGIVLAHGQSRDDVAATGAQGAYWDGAALEPLNVRANEARVAERVRAAFA